METHISAERIANEVKRLISEGAISSDFKPTSKRGVEKYCVRHNVPFVKEKAKGGPGGERKLFAVASIPGLPAPLRDVFGMEATRAAKAGAQDAKAREEEVLRTPQQESDHKEECLIKFNALTKERQESALAKHEVIKACNEYLRGAGFKSRNKGERETWSTEGVKRFIALATAQGSDLLEPWVIAQFKRKGETSLGYRTMLSWRDAYDRDGLWGLADKYVGRDTGTLTKDHKEFIEGCIVEHPKMTLKKVHQALEARYAGQTVPSIWAIERFLKKWKEEKASVWLYLTNPDEWRNKYMFAAGDAAEHVHRLNQEWQADSTPGDIMLIDGRHNIVGIIDVWPRRPRFLVCPTSKSAYIAALLRRCLLEWGKPESFKTDNGQDYTANYLEAVLRDLDIEHPLCRPFSPEEKPHIERALQTMSHGIVELLPGYIGHSVEDRKAIEARKSFANRLMTKGETVEVKLTSVQLQSILDRWTDAMYMHDPHNGLDGMTPAEMVRSWTDPVKTIGNIRALDLLLLPAPDSDGMRYISKKGIRVTYDAAILNYIAPEFAGHEGERVLVKPDLADLGHAVVYLETGEFLCWAEDPTWYGISRAEAASHLKAKQKQLIQEGTRELKAQARKLKTKDIAMEILEHREAKLRAETANVVEMPKRTEEYTTPALEEAARALNVRDSGPVPKAPSPTPEQLEMKNQIREELQRRTTSNVVGLVQETAKQRFKRWKKLKGELRDGVTIAEEDYAFVASYEKSAECQAFLMVEADLGSMSK